MKNNLIIFFLVFLFLINSSKAEEFKFETSEIEIVNSGEVIIANDGKAVSLSGDLEIIAKKFKYTKAKGILEAEYGTAHFISDNLKVEFDIID